MNLRPPVRAAALLSVACLFASGCSRDNDKAPGPRATASAKGGSGPQERDGSRPPKKGSRGGAPFSSGDEVLTVAIKSPNTLDPMLIGGTGSTLVARQLFEGLTKWDPVREEVVPAAAESWRVKDKGARFIFKLKKHMEFHDGSPVRADDFEFAFDRIARKENASDIAYVLERVQGFEAVNRSDTENHLEGIETPDKRTLVIRLDEPDQNFPAVLTHPSLVPLPAKAVGKTDKFLRRPVGNGPFRMAKPWAIGDQVVLESFEGAIESPQIDGIRFITYPEAAVSYIDFLEGKLHVAEVPVGQTERAEKEFGDQGFKPLLNTYAYSFNLRSRGLRSIKLRRAINHAVDREAIATAVYKGILQAPRGILPAGMPGFEEDACGALCEFSPSAARDLVASLPARFKSVTIEYPKEEPHGVVAKLLKKNLESVGLQASVNPYSFSKFLRLLQARDQSLYRLTWIAEYPSPDAFLAPLFESESAENHSGFSSKKVDTLLRRARSTGAETKRTALYAKAERAILEEVPIVPIGSFRIYWAAQPEVQDIQFDVMGGFDAAGVTLGP